MAMWLILCVMAGDSLSKCLCHTKNVTMALWTKLLLMHNKIKYTQTILLCTYFFFGGIDTIPELLTLYFDNAAIVYELNKSIIIQQ